MTRYTPNWIQQGNYAAVNDRRLIGAIWPNEGVSGMVASAGAGMTVNIAAGVAVVNIGLYNACLCSSNATEAVVIPTAPPSNPRIDLIVCQVRSNELDGGPNNDWLFQVVTGTPAASPVPPAVPARAVEIAQVLVPAGSVSVIAGNITDIRPAQLNQPWGAAWGVVAVGRVTANATGISAVTDLVQTSAYAQQANRRYTVTAHIPQTLQQTAAGTIIANLMDSAGQVRQAARFTAVPAGQGPSIQLIYEYEPTTAVAGQYYKARISTTAGTVDVTMSGTQPGLVVVSDAGPLAGTSPP